MMDTCCPQEVTLGAVDEQLTQRIKEDVMKKIKQGGAHTKGHAKGKKILRTVLLAAVIGTLMTATAFATGLFSMEKRTVEEGEVPSGYWRFYDSDGNLTEEEKWVYPDAGIVFTFMGPESEHNRPEFKIGWLPEGEHYDEQAGVCNVDGWMHSYGQMCMCKDIGCQIGVSNVHVNGYQAILNGKPTVLKEEYWGEWYVTEISSDYRGTSFERAYHDANYIFMFDESRGFLVTVRGTEDMEILEKVAKNLEIRESDTPPVQSGSPLDEIQIGCIDLGRG